MTAFRWLKVPLLLLVLAAPLLACTFLFNWFAVADDVPPPTFPTPTPAPVDEPSPLMVAQFEGGLCVYGACWGRVLVFENGVYHVEDGTGAARTLNLTLKETRALADAIAEADFEAIRSVPFTDTCPIAYDGQEIVFTFYRGEQTETLSSCEFVLDERYELFRVVGELFERYGTSGSTD